MTAESAQSQTEQTYSQGQAMTIGPQLATYQITLYQEEAELWAAYVRKAPELDVIGSGIGHREPACSPGLSP